VESPTDPNRPWWRQRWGVIVPGFGLAFMLGVGFALVAMRSGNWHVGAGEQCIGSIHCVCGWSSHTSAEWQRNFDSARGFGLDTQGNPIPPERVDESDLIAQAIVGGKAQAGIHLFRSGDADHDTLRQWLSGTTQPSCNTIN
jgi:hypothetical protein